MSLVGSSVRVVDITAGFVGSCITGVRTTVHLIVSSIRSVGIIVSCVVGIGTTVSIVGSSVRGGKTVESLWGRGIMTVIQVRRVGSRAIGVRTCDSLAIVGCGQ
jgi:hypothetical protein